MDEEHVQQAGEWHFTAASERVDIPAENMHQARAVTADDMVGRSKCGANNEHQAVARQ